MPSFLKMSLVTGIPFGVGMGAFFAFMYGPTFGAIGGIACALLFGPSMAAFGAYQKAKLKGQCPLVDGEIVVKEGPANHFRRGEGVGGWLFLTNKRLYFTSHKVNIQVHELSLPLQDILNAEAVTTAWVIPNGLKVVTSSGDERFVVEKRGSWAEAIEHAKEA